MSARRTRLATVGILVLILGTGFVIGLAWERGLVAAPAGSIEEVAEVEEGSDEGRRRGLIVERVGLTVEQKALVDSIVTHNRDLMRDLRREYRTGHRGLIESTRTALKSALTAEQAIQYDSLLAEYDRRRREERERESSNDES